MEFVMIVEPDEVGRKRLEAVFQTEKPSFSYQITGRPEEALDILEHQKTNMAMKLCCLLTFPAAAGMWALAQPISKLLYGTPLAGEAIRNLAPSDNVPSCILPRNPSALSSNAASASS